MSVKEKLEGELDKTNWTSLKPHHERQALIFVGQELGLVETALAFCNDKKELVEAWLKDHRIRKSSKEDELKYDAYPKTEFEFLIVQPFVLAKEIESIFH